MTTGYNYKDYKEDDEEIKIVDDYFNTVMIEKDMKKYVLKFIASCFDGHSREQKFILWTGIGCHKKDSLIILYDGTRKKVQDIKYGDKLMGDDGKPRTVKVLYTGEQDMYKIFLDNGENFIVNKDHRLALRNKFNKNIYEGIDIYDQNIHWVEWYEYIENTPVKRKTAFITKEKATKYFEKEIKRKETFIRYDEVIPVMVNNYINLDDETKNDFVMYNNKIDNKKNYNDECENINYYEYAMKNDFLNKEINFTKMKLIDRIKYTAGLINKYGNYDDINNRYILPKKIFEDEANELIIRSIGFRIEISGAATINSVYIKNGPIKLLSEVVNNNGEYINIINEESDKCSRLIGINKLSNKIENTYVNAEYKITNMENMGKDRFYGFEIDGDEKYLMGNMMATYNSNGKSTTVELIQTTLGEYFGILPTTVLTRKRANASNATPELADKRGKRVLFIQEPEHDDTVYVGLMKNLTGGDWIEARALYGNPFRYKPQFKLVLVCNRLPHVPANDQGTWRRLRVTPWESKFIDGQTKKKNEFKKDKTLPEKMKKWKYAFAWLILNKYYRDYKENGLEEPAKVTQFTDVYKKDQDVFSAFFGENYEITSKNKDRLPLQIIYDSFKNYIKSMGGVAIPARKEFEEFIKNNDRLKLINGTIIGAKEKEEKSDEEILDDDDDNDNNDNNKESEKKKSKVVGKSSMTMSMA